jgi:hypothetical protein
MGMNRASAEHLVGIADATADHFEMGDLKAMANQPVSSLGIAY